MNLPMMDNKSVIIVAGGSGLRMGSDIPKQFLPLRGLPVLMHTVRTFNAFDPDMQIVIVLAKSQHGRWRELCRQHSFTIPHILAEGGETRFHSVRNGLSCLGREGLIGVHDGVRPFVSSDVIRRCYEAAAEHGAAIPVVPVNETVRRLSPDGTSVTVDRSAYRLVQTPQVFDARLLHEAYSVACSSAFTDDASVVEASGHGIFLVEGNRENIKLTTPFDLLVAEALL